MTIHQGFDETHETCPRNAVRSSRTLRAELTDPTFIFGQRHVRRVPNDDVSHDNQRRPPGREGSDHEDSRPRQAAPDDMDPRLPTRRPPCRHPAPVRRRGEIGNRAIECWMYGSRLSTCGPAPCSTRQPAPRHDLPGEAVNCRSVNPELPVPLGWISAGVSPVAGVKR